jgi:hypothetical protein
MLAREFLDNKQSCLLDDVLRPPREQCELVELVGLRASGI